MHWTPDELLDIDADYYDVLVDTLKEEANKQQQT